ncbi:MAG: NAD-dependent epimerase/dehydratase family protein [Bacilli bacterium]|jgi:UDP-2-acetamido-2,6-beta-L-arabino-hexul-4-ose reductase|nr:NAD-dependent epimerase/dehydratase family protein [Bacilli bacterium]MDD4344932.1 NAD-dependent epimerase/dehydratase family protein [Bacilli bacterium]MDY0399485.1 NAD-dependent epimerase/dehydratase family protein [Bacilli bacterium]
MKILVTGAQGFVGKNLCLVLNEKGHQVFEYDLGSTKEELVRWIKEADFIVHLAGVNRPLTNDEFYNGNANFTFELTSLMEEYSCKSPIIYSSTIQAERDNDYGRSKKMAEDYLREFSIRTGTPVFIYRLSNLFGKWSRPNYNSVIATFAYNIARDLPIRIDDSEAMINFIYIDDLVFTMLNMIENPQQVKIQDYYFIEPNYPIKIGQLANTIRQFKASRTTLMVPKLDDDFTRKLYATYLSYLPEDDFGYALTMNKDDRGSFTEFLRSEGAGQVSINVTKPGITKGNHWHHTKNEKFLVVSGQAEINFRKIGTTEIITYQVNGDDLRVIDIPTGYTHNITNIGDHDLVTIMWASEPYDKNNPDTHFEKV